MKVIKKIVTLLPLLVKAYVIYRKYEKHLPEKLQSGSILKFISSVLNKLTLKITNTQNNQNENSDKIPTLVKDSAETDHTTSKSKKASKAKTENKKSNPKNISKPAPTNRRASK